MNLSQIITLSVFTFILSDKNSSDEISETLQLMVDESKDSWKVHWPDRNCYIKLLHAYNWVHKNHVEVF